MKINENATVSNGADVSIESNNDASKSTGGLNAEGKRMKDYREQIREQNIKVKKNGLPTGIHLDNGVEPNGRDKRLSPRATLFASLVMEGHTPVNAYMKSYNADNQKHATIVSSANKLMRDARITLLLEPLWQAKKEMILTDERIARKHIMAELFKHSNAEDTPINMKLRSLELMGKAVGMFHDKIEQASEVIDVESLKSELQSSLRLLERKH